jgi:hypothetical protein
MEKNNVQLYQIFYRGKLAATSSEMGFPLTLFRAKGLRDRLMREKGWTESDTVIKPAPDSSVNQTSN